VDLNLAGAQQVAAALPNGAFSIEADVADVASVGRAVTLIMREASRIEILVNNAGIAGPAAYIWEQTDEDWQGNIAINLTGIFNRTGKPDELASLVHFLASSECSFVTGQGYDASGGRATY
jgi:NAD(P)-dependent dehydrogenase (short-subunit alcohol dehydrogenase family)